MAKSIVCFANTDGGQIIVGVSDRGEIAGVENLDDAMKLADDVAFNRCNPPITIIQETVRVEDKKILVINVPKGKEDLITLLMGVVMCVQQIDAGLLRMKNF